MGPIQGGSCNPVSTVIHDPVMQVKAASRKHCTPAGHHSVRVILGEDEGACIIQGNALRALGQLPLAPAGHLHQASWSPLLAGSYALGNV